MKEKLDRPRRARDSLTGNGDFLNNFLKSNGVSNFEADPYGFGEVAKETTADQVKNYNYRADGKMTSFQSGSTSVNYLYDGLDRLVAKLINDHGTSYTQSYVRLGEENRVLMGKAGDGSVTAYIDGQGVAGHLGEVKAGTGKAYITDHLGSVLNSPLAGSGHSYGLFGEAVGASVMSPAGSPVMFGFSGHMFDVESGLSRTKYRLYNPKVGRWLSQEPLGFDGPNFYWYGRNNPLLYVDPTGLRSYVSVGPGGIENNVVIDYKGSGVSPEVVEKFNRAIEQSWSRYGVRTRVHSSTNSCQSGGNEIEVPLGDGRAYVNHDGDSGNWPSERPGWTAAHEAGHLMGLDDQYDESTGSANPGYENSIMGARDEAPTQQDVEESLSGDE